MAIFRLTSKSLLKLTVLVATILILAFVFGLGHAAAAHEWYMDYKNPQTGVACCTVKDCRVVEDVVETGEGFGVVHEGELLTIPYNQTVPSQDGNYHACIVTTIEHSTYLRCLFVPGSA